MRFRVKPWTSHHRIISIITLPAASTSHRPPVSHALLDCFKTSLRHRQRIGSLDFLLHFRILELVGPSGIFWYAFLILGKSRKIICTRKSDAAAATRPLNPRPYHFSAVGLATSLASHPRCPGTSPGSEAPSVHRCGRPEMPGELLPCSPATFRLW